MKIKFDMKTISGTFFACLLIGIVLFHSRAWFSDYSPKRDFDSYYCGAKVVLEGRDPYLVEPLRTCEASLGKSSIPSVSDIDAFFVTPTPLPGYDLALLAPLAELPYRLARILFGLSCLAAGVATAVCLSRLSVVPLLPALGICFFAINFDPMGNNGAMAPIAICLIALAATLAHRGRVGLSIVALGAAMIQPQIAAFSLIAAFIFFPKHRWTVIIVTTGLCAISFATLGLSGNIEYLKLLPLHTASEVLSPFQRSFAGLLASLGVNPLVALSCGTAWSVVMLVAAMIVVRKLSVAANTMPMRNVAVVVVPTAFAAFGGTFMHETQMAVAIVPALCYVRPQGRLWALPALALGFLVIPIEDIGLTHRGLPMLGVFAIALSSAWLLIYYLSDSQNARFRSTVVSLILAIVLVLAVVAKPTYHEVNVAGFGIQGSQLATTAWALFQSALIAANNGTIHDKVFYFFMRMTLWFSIVVVIICTIGAAQRCQGRSKSASETLGTQPTYA